jgi:GntR family transcriptional regulator
VTSQRRIDPDSGRPLYRQLADILREQIQIGELAGGADLPSQKHLRDTYDVGARTVEQALAVLKAEGLIVMERGRVARVRPVRVVDSARYEAGARNYGPDQASSFAREHGVAWTDFDLSRVYETVPAPARIAQALGLAPDTPVVARRWVHATGGTVLRVSWSYLDAAKFGDTILCDPDEPPWPGGTIAQLKHLGYNPFTEPPVEVRCRPGTDEECALLQVDPGTFVLEELRIHTQQSGFYNSWESLEASVRVYPWYAVVLKYNSVEKRRWISGD